MAWQTCSDHEWMNETVKKMKILMEELRNNKKFWNRILNSKWFFWALTGFVGIFLLFGAWVVNEVYVQKSNEERNKKSAQVICQKVEEIKNNVKNNIEKVDKKLDDTIKEIKKEMKEDNQRRDEQRRQDQMELMRVLMKIQDKIKK